MEDVLKYRKQQVLTKMTKIDVYLFRKKDLDIWAYHIPRVLFFFIVFDSNVYKDTKYHLHKTL